MIVKEKSSHFCPYTLVAYKMFLEVLALVCLLSRTLGVGNLHTASTPVISYIAKENRALKVPGNPG